MTPGVHFEHASVVLPVPHRPMTLKHRLVGRGDPRRGNDGPSLLRDISFTAHDGERIGVLGRNGAGKTTLLKAIAGILPVRGVRKVQGSVAPVIAQAVAFDHELSVHTNVKLSMALNGRISEYSEDLARQILAFAELEDRPDDPLRTLSSGLQARLGFAISLFQSPDIYLLDEAFATGDAHFLAKAKAAMAHRFSQAAITFFVSHDQYLVRENCSRCILLHHGGIVADGDASTVLAEYLSHP
jgi:homopolymeric O-antigen transport system ATP-binding protein